MYYPKIIVETAQFQLMVQLAEANLGIALLPDAVCKNLDDNTVVSRSFNDPQIYLELALVWKKERYLSHAARELLNFVKAFLAVRTNKFYKRQQ